MNDVNRVSIIIPVFNEEGNLLQLKQELTAVMDRIARIQTEVIFIDDGSSDGSREHLRRFAEEDPRCKIVFFRRNYGQTAAMSCGIRLAAGDVIIPMDADLQNDPADIPLFLEKIREGYSCVSGWRQHRKDAFWSRTLPSWVANRMISWMTGVHIHDYGCSLKAYRSEIIKETELYGEMHRFIPAYAAWMGARVTEIPVHHRERIHGVSKYGLSRVFKVILDLLVVLFLTRYFNKPMHFFGTIGFGSLVIGTLAELAAVALRFQGFHLVQTPLPTVGAMFIIVGVQFILFGLMAEVLMRTYYESRQTRPYAVSEAYNVDVSV